MQKRSLSCTVTWFEMGFDVAKLGTLKAGPHQTHPDQMNLEAGCVIWPLKTWSTVTRHLKIGPWIETTTLHTSHMVGGSPPPSRGVLVQVHGPPCRGQVRRYRRLQWGHCHRFLFQNGGASGLGETVGITDFFFFKLPKVSNTYRYLFILKCL